MKEIKTKKELVLAIEEQKARLDAAEQTLQDTRRGNVDALVVIGPQSEQLSSLAGAAPRVYLKTGKTIR
jgi:hypothetical protein